MIQKFWRENRFLLKPFLVILAIYLVGILAIILSGVHYADDIARTNLGYAGWSGFSRYASTILAHGIHADNYLANIAPLPQILGTVFLAISSVILMCVVGGKEVFKEPVKKWIFRVIAVVPLGLCPYMLECLSYQYDAVYMGLSVFLVMMPFVFYRAEKWKFVLASIIGILGVCITYQASIGIYPMIIVFIAMKDFASNVVSNKEIIKKVIVSAVVFVITLVFFQKVLMRPQDMYVSNEIPGISEFFPSLFSHLGHYFELLFSDFRMLWLVLIGIMVILFVVLYTLRSKKNKVVSVIVGFLGLLLMAISAYILYAALDTPLYTTRAMYAIGALFAIVGIYIVSGGIFREYHKKHIGKRAEMKFFVSFEIREFVLAIPVVALSWCFFSFGFVYGNALKEQDTFRNMQIDMVISDLNDLTNDGKVRKIQTIGQIGFAPAVEHTPEGNYYILRRLLKPSFEKNVPWMSYRLTEASGLMSLVFDPVANLKDKNLPVMKDTVLYTIYGDDGSILVEFKGREFNIWES